MALLVVVLLLVLHQTHLSYQQVSLLQSPPLEPPGGNTQLLADPLRTPGQQHEVAHNARQGFPQH